MAVAISLSGSSPMPGSGRWSRSRAIASLDAACAWSPSRSSSSPRLIRRYSRSSASACCCQARWSSSGTLSSSTATSPRSSRRLSTWTSRPGSAYVPVVPMPTAISTQTVLPASWVSMPQSSTGALDQPQAAPGPGQGAVAAQHGQVAAAVAHLDPQPGVVDDRVHLDRGPGVHQRVGDELGDERARRVHQVGPAGRRQDLAHQPSGVTDARRVGGEGSADAGGVLLHTRVVPHLGRSRRPCRSPDGATLGR